MRRLAMTTYLQGLRRGFVLTVAFLLLYLICVQHWTTLNVTIRDIHPFHMISDTIRGRPCKSMENAPDSIMSHGKENQSLKILYLVQTEECLPTHLRLALGDSSACHCDVVVLSFRDICKDTSLAHVSYIFNSSTTWTSGRNLLYYTHIYNKTGSYLYYILMDDDIQLKWREGWMELYRNKDPWRKFEDFIRRIQPPIAVIEVGEKPLIHTEELHVSRDCCMDPEYTVTVRYDAAFNAFHYQAVEHALPYWEHLDNISWFYSQLHLLTWTEVVFRGQVLVHRKVMGFNAQHRSYPRAGHFDLVIPMIIKNIRERLPVQCQNTSLLEECEKMGFEHLRTNSSTYCLPPPPPKQPISPFKNFLC